MLAQTSAIDFENYLFAEVNRNFSGTETSFAIAFSGGGDSTALIYALRNHPQKSHVFIVDHGLRQGARTEALAAKAFAEGLGYKVQILTWQHVRLSANFVSTGDKAHFVTGLQEKARKARYGLLGQACRDVGIEVLLTGHTQDDQAETLFMRYERQTDWRGACGMKAVLYGPMWPALAEVTLMRPLLNVSRKALRGYNLDCGLNWVEDPSNNNLAFSRIQARQYLSKNPKLKNILLDPVTDLKKGRATERLMMRNWANTNLKIDAGGFCLLKSPPTTELLYHLIRAVGGTGGPIDRMKLRALRLRMLDPAFKAATLGGSQVVAYRDGFCINRDPVAVKGRRGSIAPIAVQKISTKPRLWDGRFLVQGPEDGWTVGSAFQRISSFSKPLKERIMSLPPSARPTQPVLIDPLGEARAVGAKNGEGFLLTSLVKKRIKSGFKI